MNEYKHYQVFKMRSFIRFAALNRLHRASLVDYNKRVSQHLISSLQLSVDRRHRRIFCLLSPFFEPQIVSELSVNCNNLWVSNQRTLYAFTRLLFSNTVRRYKYCNDLQALEQVRGDLFGRYYKGNDC